MPTVDNMSQGEIFDTCHFNEASIKQTVIYIIIIIIIAYLIERLNDKYFILKASMEVFVFALGLSVMNIIKCISSK